MDGQSVLAKSLGENVQHAARIRFILKANHEVIRIANEKRAASKTRLHDVAKPNIQNVMQVHIGEHG